MAIRRRNGNPMTQTSNTNKNIRTTTVRQAKMVSMNRSRPNMSWRIVYGSNGVNWMCPGPTITNKCKATTDINSEGTKKTVI